MSYDRQWREEVPSEDAHGRALWGLGMAAASLSEPGQSALSARLFEGGLGIVLTFDGLRAQAFTLLGLDAYLRRFGGDSEARRIREQLGERLFGAFARETTDAWPWPEARVTYASGKLPHALLVTGHALGPPRDDREGPHRARVPDGPAAGPRGPFLRRSVRTAGSVETDPERGSISNPSKPTP